VTPFEKIFLREIFEAKFLFYAEKMKTKFWILPLLLGAACVYAQSLQLLYPNGDETLFVHSTIQIRWTPVDPAARVVILLFRDGAQEAVVAYDIPDAGTYGWKIPGQIQPGNHYRIRIRALNNLAVNDFSDRDFTIKKPEN
jgi:hypothetical protein